MPLLFHDSQPSSVLDENFQARQMFQTFLPCFATFLELQQCLTPLRRTKKKPLCLIRSLYFNWGQSLINRETYVFSEEPCFFWRIFQSSWISRKHLFVALHQDEPTGCQLPVWAGEICWKIQNTA